MKQKGRISTLTIHCHHLLRHSNRQIRKDDHFEWNRRFGANSLPVSLNCAARDPVITDRSCSTKGQLVE